MNELEQRVQILERELEDLKNQILGKIEYMKCPQCDSEEQIVDDMFILATYPPQYKVHCKKCNYNYTIGEKDFNFVKYRRSDCAE